MTIPLTFTTGSWTAAGPRAGASSPACAEALAGRHSPQCRRIFFSRRSSAKRPRLDGFTAPLIVGGLITYWTLPPRLSIIWEARAPLLNRRRALSGMIAELNRVQIKSYKVKMKVAS